MAIHARYFCPLTLHGVDVDQVARKPVLFKTVE
jgi:hypothetical protein